MIELPLSWRTLFVEALDQYCDGIDETTTRDDVAEAMVEQAEAIAEQLSEGPDDRLGGLFDPDFLERMSLHRIDRVIFGHREKGVRCTGIETILPEAPNGARVVYRMERGGTIGLSLQVDPEPPHHIVSLVFDGPTRTNGNGGNSGRRGSAGRR